MPTFKTNIIRFLRKIPLIRVIAPSPEEEVKVIVFSYVTMKSLLDEQLAKTDPEQAAAWFTEELKKLAAKRKSRKSNKGRKKSKKKRFVWRNFCKTRKQSITVAGCFLRLKNAFVKTNNHRQALRMLKLAGAFNPLTEKQLKEGLKMADQAHLYSGYWLGEAAVFAVNGNNFHAQNILSQAAKEGNELAKFILDLNS